VWDPGSRGSIVREGDLQDDEEERSRNERLREQHSRLQEVRSSGSVLKTINRIT
jgi:hypothetical protein